MRIEQTKANYEREYHGGNSSYWLPKDKAEQDRLVVQQEAYRTLFGGPLPLNIRDSLDFEKGVSVLDVGCGPGSWIMDMIKEYPAGTYHGCDIVDAASENAASNNFTFTEGDVTEKLPYEDNTFDFVHMRLVICGILENEWPKALQELIRVTKPGGLIQCVEVDLKVPEGKDHFFRRFFNAIEAMCKKKGQNPYIAHDLEKLFLKTKGVSVSQLDHLRFNFASDTPLSRVFIRLYIDLAKSMIQNLKPVLGINSDKEASEFISELGNTFPHTDCLLGNTSIIVKKL
ncbi:S-adenosyl-L-methionine-dependent methyltransferase [Sporodiniella umbellata]|nr:S-adenosyl-L-methionine-dependent methyltransferase [Sporodiniella umbellata]